MKIVKYYKLKKVGTEFDCRITWICFIFKIKKNLKVSYGFDIIDFFHTTVSLKMASSVMIYCHSGALVKTQELHEFCIIIDKS